MQLAQVLAGQSTQGAVLGPLTQAQLNAYHGALATQTIASGSLGGTTWTSGTAASWPWPFGPGLSAPLFPEPFMTYYSRLVKIRSEQVERLVREAQEVNDTKALDEELTLWELGRDFE